MVVLHRNISVGLQSLGLPYSGFVSLTNDCSWRVFEPRPGNSTCLSSFQKLRFSDMRKRPCLNSSVTSASKLQFPHINNTEKETRFKANGCAHTRLKTTEEMHFEALQHYCPNYDDEDDDCYTVNYKSTNKSNSKHNGAAISNPFEDSSKLDGADDQVDRLNESVEDIHDSEMNSQLHNVVNEQVESLGTFFDDAEHVNSVETAASDGNASYSSNAGVSESNDASSVELDQEQRIKMELNKAAAVARRKMKICEDKVSDAKAKGLSYPKLECLLVENSWMEVIGGEFQKPYMERLYQFISQEAAGSIPIYPPPAKLFNAFNSCPFEKVKVVILGQDPYHGPGQAMGLCFSVEKGTKIPSSLGNIFLELETDVRCEFPSHGNLEKWAYQGVLLLNTVLTVRDHHANSHAKKGWELFTDAAIRALAQQRSGLIFLLWGLSAQDKLRLINRTSHHILKAAHPSGISARKGFFNCRHFSKTNEILLNQGLLPIDWQL